MSTTTFECAYPGCGYVTFRRILVCKHIRYQARERHQDENGDVPETEVGGDNILYYVGAGGQRTACWTERQRQPGEITCRSNFDRRPDLRKTPERDATTTFECAYPGCGYVTFRRILVCKHIRYQARERHQDENGDVPETEVGGDNILYYVGAGGQRTACWTERQRLPGDMTCRSNFDRRPDLPRASGPSEGGHPPASARAAASLPTAAQAARQCSDADSPRAAIGVGRSRANAARVQDLDPTASSRGTASSKRQRRR